MNLFLCQPGSRAVLTIPASLRTLIKPGSKRLAIEIPFVPMASQLIEINIRIGIISKISKFSKRSLDDCAPMQVTTKMFILHFASISLPA